MARVLSISGPTSTPKADRLAVHARIHAHQTSMHGWLAPCSNPHIYMYPCACMDGLPHAANHISTCIHVHAGMVCPMQQLTHMQVLVWMACCMDGLPHASMHLEYFVFIYVSSLFVCEDWDRFKEEVQDHLAQQGPKAAGAPPKKKAKAVGMSVPAKKALIICQHGWTAPCKFMHGWGAPCMQALASMANTNIHLRTAI
eukprot:12405154-Karenia_brevis.AAC.1